MTRRRCCWHCSSATKQTTRISAWRSTRWGRMAPSTTCTFRCTRVSPCAAAEVVAAWLSHWSPPVVSESIIVGIYGRMCAACVLQARHRHLAVAVLWQKSFIIVLLRGADRLVSGQAYYLAAPFAIERAPTMALRGLKRRRGVHISALSQYPVRFCFLRGCLLFCSC